MKHSPSLIPLLIVVALIADLVLALGGGGATSFQQAMLTALASLSLAISQVSLVAVWVSLGRTPWWMRLVGFSTVFWFCWLVGFEALENGKLLGLSFLAVVAVATCLGMLALRIAGFDLIHTADKENRQASAMSERPFQFSIGQLLVWTTGIAMMLTGMRAVVQLSQERVELAVAIIYAIWMAALGAAAVHSVLSRRVRWLQILLLLVGMPAVTLFCIKQTGIPQVDRQMLVVLTACVNVLTIGSLWVVRQSGYRLVRHRSETNEPVELPQSVASFRRDDG